MRRPYNEPSPAEFDINRPWEHLKQKTMDEAAKAKVDRVRSSGLIKHR